MKRKSSAVRLILLAVCAAILGWMLVQGAKKPEAIKIDAPRATPSPPEPFKP